MYDVIIIQETWYNDKVTSNEIMSLSPYNINRHDRSCFINPRKEGGGVLTLLLLYC